jgi:hypothetical protein
MAGKVFPFFANYLSYPFFDFRVVHVVVIDPVFITGIVRGVYINEFYPAFIAGQEGFEGQKVVPVDYKVPGGIGGLFAFLGIDILRLKRMKRHIQVMIDYFFLTCPD